MLSSIGRSAALPPQITLNQLTAGGIREPRDDWTQSAQQTARQFLTKLQPGRIAIASDLELAEPLKQELLEVQALYRSIDMTLTANHDPMGYGYNLPTLKGRFEFSVGSVDRICEAAGADALLLVALEDDYFTSDRKALVALGVVAAAITGVYVQPSSGVSHASAALIARDGTLIWYYRLPPMSLSDLRTPAGVQETLGRLVGVMPLGSAPLAP